MGPLKDFNVTVLHELELLLEIPYLFLCHRSDPLKLLDLLNHLPVALYTKLIDLFLTVMHDAVSYSVLCDCLRKLSSFFMRMADMYPVDRWRSPEGCTFNKDSLRLGTLLLGVVEACGPNRICGAPTLILFSY